MKSLKDLCAAVAITFATMTPASAWWMSSDTGMSLSVGAGSYLLNNEVATGLASFLAGAYMAYNNQNVSNSHVKPLANQLRRALAAERDFAQVTDAEKQRMYDATVMLGMLMATTQVQL